MAYNRKYYLHRCLKKKEIKRTKNIIFIGSDTFISNQVLQLNKEYNYTIQYQLI